jgi:hypothetical protein
MVVANETVESDPLVEVIFFWKIKKLAVGLKNLAKRPKEQKRGKSS